MGECHKIVFWNEARAASSELLSPSIGLFLSFGDLPLKKIFLDKADAASMIKKQKAPQETRSERTELSSGSRLLTVLGGLIVGSSPLARFKVSCFLFGCLSFRT